MHIHSLISLKRNETQLKTKDTSRLRNFEEMHNFERAYLGKLSSRVNFFLPEHVTNMQIAAANTSYTFM